MSLITVVEGLCFNLALECQGTAFILDFQQIMFGFHGVSSNATLTELRDIGQLLISDSVWHIHVQWINQRSGCSYFIIANVRLNHGISQCAVLVLQVVANMWRGGGGGSESQLIGACSWMDITLRITWLR